jgi:hypothetical protein
MSKKGRVWVVFVALSILISSAIFGTYKRTLSSTLGEMEPTSSIARGFCNALEVILNDPNHCIKEYNDYLEELKK